MEKKTLKEFLYVDIQRVRSYYGQMNRGIIDSVKSTSSVNGKGQLEAKMFGLGGRGEASGGYAKESSRSLQEILYVLFEENFESEGRIIDNPRLFEDVDAWRSGRLHESIREGQIIRYTGNIQIMDPSFASGRIDQILNLVTALAGFQIPGNPAGSPATPPVRKGGGAAKGKAAKTPEEMRDVLKKQLASQMLGGQQLTMSNIGEFIRAFTNGSTSVSIHPCGFDQPGVYFSGSLLGRSDYIQEEREELFARYGTQLEGWTTVMQVARMPKGQRPQSFESEDLLTEEGVIDRAKTIRFTGDFMRFIEGMGAVEGVVFPSVSVTPLAIYRSFR
jgi:hypothetical protein